MAENEMGRRRERGGGKYAEAQWMKSG